MVGAGPELLAGSGPVAHPERWRGQQRRAHVSGTRGLSGSTVLLWATSQPIATPARRKCNVRWPEPHRGTVTVGRCTRTLGTRAPRPFLAYLAGPRALGQAAAPTPPDSGRRDGSQSSPSPCQGFTVTLPMRTTVRPGRGLHRAGAVTVRPLGGGGEKHPSTPSRKGLSSGSPAGGGPERGGGRGDNAASGCAAQGRAGSRPSRTVLLSSLGPGRPFPLSSYTSCKMTGLRACPTIATTFCHCFRFSKAHT